MVASSARIISRFHIEVALYLDTPSDLLKEAPQVNIATDGGQQVNVGEVKKEG